MMTGLAGQGRPPMRFLRVVLIVSLPAVLAGCFSDGSRSHWLNPLPLLRSTADEDSALVQYVIVERTEGTEEINRRAWDRVDEQILSFETRTMLEEAGLRVGTTSESLPGVMRKLV